MACVYLTWISLTKASRLILPAPPISAASASRRKWRVVSTSSSTSLHLWYKSIFCCLLYTYSVIKKNVQKKFFLWSLKHVFESKHSTRISGLWLLNFWILWDQLIVWWFLYTCTYSVIQNVSRKFSSHRACSTAWAFWYFDYLKISIITSPWSCLKGQNREHFWEARDCLSTVHHQWGSHCLSVHHRVSDRTLGCRHGVRTFWSETDCLVALRLWKGENQN